MKCSGKTLRKENLNRNLGAHNKVKWLLWFLVWVIGRIPFSIRTKLGHLLGWIFSFIPSRDREIALLQIKVFLSPQKPLKVLRGVYAHFGSTILECLNLSPMIKKPDDFIDFPSWSLAQDLLNRKRGIIALSAHLGNWDAMGAFFANKNVPLLAIAKQARNPATHFVLEKLRKSFGFNTLWRANKKGIAEILKCLNAGQVVAAVIDQDTRVSSIPIQFFNTPASTPYTIIEIGKKVNALFVTAFVVKTDAGRFDIRIKEIPSDLSTEEILIEYNKQLESIIREYPEQWAWIHKRWRTLTSTERLGGKQYLEYLKTALANKEMSKSREGNNSI